MHTTLIGMVDNDAALGAMVKGYSNTTDVCDLVSAIWEDIAKYSINVYLDRVSSDSNVSDGVSRDSWIEQQQCDWDITHVDFPDYIRGELDRIQAWEYIDKDKQIQIKLNNQNSES